MSTNFFFLFKWSTINLEQKKPNGRCINLSNVLYYYSHFAATGNSRIILFVCLMFRFFVVVVVVVVYMMIWLYLVHRRKKKNRFSLSSVISYYVSTSLITEKFSINKKKRKKSSLTIIIIIIIWPKQATDFSSLFDYLAFWAHSMKKKEKFIAFLNYYMMMLFTKFFFLFNEKIVRLPSSSLSLNVPRKKRHSEEKKNGYLYVCVNISLLLKIGFFLRICCR